MTIVYLEYKFLTSYKSIQFNLPHLFYINVKKIYKGVGTCLSVIETQNYTTDLTKLSMNLAVAVNVQEKQSPTAVSIYFTGTRWIRLMTLLPQSL